MTPVSHGKPCAGNLHARFDEGASASEEPRRNALLHKKPGKNGALEILPVDIYDDCLKSVKSDADVSEEKRSAYEQAARVRIGNGGRIRIPQELLSCVYPGTGGKIVLRGHISTIDVFKASDTSPCGSQVC